MAYLIDRNGLQSAIIRYEGSIAKPNEFCTGIREHISRGRSMSDTKIITLCKRLLTYRDIMVDNADMSELFMAVNASGKRLVYVLFKP